MDEVKLRLLRRISKSTAADVAARVRDALRLMKYTLSGEDSDLENTWQEICVQVQDELTPFWEAYETAMLDAVRGHLLDVAPLLHIALWFHTEDGDRWLDDLDGEAENMRASGQKFEIPSIDEVPVNPDDVAMFIVRGFVLPLAMNDEDPAVYRYLHPDDDRLYDTDDN